MGTSRLACFDRYDLRRALWLLRRQHYNPRESNPAAAQFDGFATLGQVRVKYRRRGWSLPQITHAERDY